MSVRLLTTRLIKHGRYFVQSFYKRDIHFDILEQNKAKRRIPASGIRNDRASVAAKKTPPTTINITDKGTSSSPSPSSSSSLLSTPSVVSPRSGIFRFGQHARRLFIDSVLSRVTTPLAADIRHEATKKMFYGDSAPFFALLGVSLATGGGLLTKDQEVEGVCWEIRSAAERLQASWDYHGNSDSNSIWDDDFNIDKLNIGPAIAKGSSAVVYAAALKDNAAGQPRPPDDDDDDGGGFESARLPPLQVMSRFVHHCGRPDENSNAWDNNSIASFFSETSSLLRRDLGNNDEEQQASGRQSGRSTSRGGSLDMQSLATLQSDCDLRYPFALKMMFNYDIESNAASILRAMHNETLPSRQQRCLGALTPMQWERTNEDDAMLTLPPHPNIVCMWGYFCDEVRNLPDGHVLYPLAQPERINPHGYGRNMSLYLLMKRYDCTLRQFLSSPRPLTVRTRLLLLAQLLEAVAHINGHRIAHRDLKSDNILIDMNAATADDNDEQQQPSLVITDFGCCLADRQHGLKLPFTYAGIDRGGNIALMAPEILKKRPGPFSVLNYTKADLWACGAIAYEIFGERNPFYKYKSPVVVAAAASETPSSSLLSSVEPADDDDDDDDESHLPLQNCSYTVDDLPPLSANCPPLVQCLIHNILSPNPAKRLSPDVAANVVQLFLWAPSQWLRPGGTPSSSDILQWLLSLTTKVMCENRWPPSASSSSRDPGHDYDYDCCSLNGGGRRTYVEYMLICSFLTRARLSRIRNSLNWIQSEL